MLYSHLYVSEVSHTVLCWFSVNFNERMKTEQLSH